MFRLKDIITKARSPGVKLSQFVSKSLSKGPIVVNATVWRGHSQ